MHWNSIDRLNCVFLLLLQCDLHNFPRRPKKIFTFCDQLVRSLKRHEYTRNFWLLHNSKAFQSLHLACNNFIGGFAQSQEFYTLPYVLLLLLLILYLCLIYFAIKLCALLHKIIHNFMIYLLMAQKNPLIHITDTHVFLFI